MPVVTMKKLPKIDNEWKSRSQKVLAQGFPGTNSKRWTHYPETFPSHIQRGDRCYLFDAWGNRYTDFVSGLGTNILGYNNNLILESMAQQAAQGTSHSLPTTLEVEVAEYLRDLIPAAEKIRFLKTGSEACSAAVRIARAATGRKIILTEGYHGHHDIFTSMNEPALGVSDKFQIHDLTKENIALFSTHIAAVILEPVALEMSEQRRIYLNDLQRACKAMGTLVIYDEIITGFRVPKFSISNHWGLDPDIICLGKAMANGMPLAAVCGKKEIMDCGEYFVSSTYSGEALSLAACQSVMHQLQSNKKLDDLFYYGGQFRAKLNNLDPDICFEGWNTRAMLNMTHPKTALFAQEMARSGVLFGKAWFYNFAHIEENIMPQVLSLAEDCLHNLPQAKLEGRLPEESFKR